MKVIRRSRSLVATVLAILLLGCGGSGSTGLISAEVALLDEVRSSNECLDAQGTLYCPAVPREEVSGDEIPISPQPGPLEPCQDCSEASSVLYVFETGDLAAGTRCSVATRMAPGPWELDALADVGSAAIFEVEVPTESLDVAERIDAALVCFENSARSDVPGSVEFLSDLQPSVVFVAPSLSASP